MRPDRRIGRARLMGRDLLFCFSWLLISSGVFLASGGTETELTTSGTTLGLRIDGKGRCVVVSPPRCPQLPTQCQQSPTSGLGATRRLPGTETGSSADLAAECADGDRWRVSARKIRGFAMHQDIGNSSASGRRRQLCVTPLVRHAAPPAPLVDSVKPG